MEFILKTLNDQEIMTNTKTNPRKSVHINKIVNDKIKTHKKSFKEIGYDVTDLQVINAGLEALDVVKPNDINLMRLELSKRETENSRMLSTIASLHRTIQKLKKQNANPTNK